MNTDEMKALILRHYESINYTPDIDKWKYHELMWAHWEALAHFSMDNYYTSLNQAPADLPSIWVTEGEVINNYEWVNGEYVYVQQWTKELCYDVYGNRVPGSY